MQPVSSAGCRHEVTLQLSPLPRWCWGQRGQGVLTEGSQHVMQILLVDEAITVLVNHVEGLLELLDLRLVEHGKDIGGGALGALLGGLGFGTFAGHLGGWGSTWGQEHKEGWGQAKPGGPRRDTPPLAPLVLCLNFPSCHTLGEHREVSQSQGQAWGWAGLEL